MTSSGAIFGTWQYRSDDDGATWTDEGQLFDGEDRLLPCQHLVTIGADIYTSFRRGASAPYANYLYKSEDNGASWDEVSQITDSTTPTLETAIAWLGGTNLLVIMRDLPSGTTYARRSSDLGATWGTLENVGGTFGIFQRPRMTTIDDRLYLHGRDYLDGGTLSPTAFYASDDDGATWRGPYYLGGQMPADGGYPTIAQRANGDFYVLNYEGTYDAASIVEYVLTPVI